MSPPPLRPEELERVLANPVRRRVYELVVGQPGLAVSDVARRLGLYWTSAALHIGHLTKAGLIASTRIGRRRVLVPAAGPDLDFGFELGLLAEGSCRRVALAILEHPGRSVLDLCGLTGMSERAVYHHVKRLEEAGLVVKRTKLAHRGLDPAPRLFLALGRHGFES